MTTESPPVVLVADDEPSMLALVGQHIKTMGYTVLEASDGEQAWLLAQEHLPDLVILDVMMPGMSGWEVCRKIREDVALAHTAIIMLTGIGENLNELTSPLYGADSYIDKPFAFAELDDKVRGALHKHQGSRPGLARTEPGDEAESNGNGGREHRVMPSPPTESGPPLPDDDEEAWTGNENPEVTNGHDESVMLVKTESLEPTRTGRKVAESAMRPPRPRKSGRSHTLAGLRGKKNRPTKEAKPVAKSTASKTAASKSSAVKSTAKSAAALSKAKAAAKPKAGSKGRASTTVASGRSPKPAARTSARNVKAKARPAKPAARRTAPKPMQKTVARQSRKGGKR
jgi:CheY-like chemotaxis protein